MRLMIASLALAATAATVAVPTFAANAKTADFGGNDQVTLVKAADGQYCASFEVTGSRFGQRVCKTRAEWLADGAQVRAVR